VTDQEPRFLDTNVLIRHLSQDDEEKAARALALLLRVARGEEVVEASPIVFFEVIFTLHRQYRLPRQQIRDLAAPIIALSGLRLEDKPLFERALELFVELNTDVADAFNVAVMEARGIDTIYSWDTDFDRFPDPTRLEPDGGDDTE
jgi:predicted nucleic acid-binding protein